MDFIIRAAISLSVVISLSAYSDYFFQADRNGKSMDAEKLTLRYFPGPQASILALIGRADVSTELGVDEIQKQAIDEVLQAYRDEMHSCIHASRILMRSQPSGSQVDSILNHARQSQASIIQHFELQIGRLLTEGQSERLSQLQIQRSGLSALQRPELVASLKITETQSYQISELVPATFSSAASAGKRFEADRELFNLLDGTQQKTWMKLKGTQFLFEHITENELQTSSND